MLRAQPKPVKIAVIAPLSGPWARQGTLVKWGAETAINEINAAGGIKAMGGAKLELVAIDAGDSAEKAKNAAQRLVAQEPDVVGGMGAWLSTFTLAVTEVTERAQIPWLTLSYADCDHRPRLQVRLPELDAGRAAAGRRAADDPGRLPRPRPARRRRPPASSATTPPRRSRSSSRCAKAGWQKLGIKVADGRDLHAAALRRDAADPEGALDPAGIPDLRHAPPSRT